MGALTTFMYRATEDVKKEKYPGEAKQQVHTKTFLGGGGGISSHGKEDRLLQACIKDTLF